MSQPLTSDIEESTPSSHQTLPPCESKDGAHHINLLAVSNHNTPQIPINDELASGVAPQPTIEDITCHMCRIDVDEGILCNMCHTWVHQECLHMSDEEYLILTNNDNSEWYCARCRHVKTNKIKWGDYCGEENIGNAIQSAYSVIIGWKKNIFLLPRGNSANEFIKELTRIINLFVDKTKWQRLALSLVHIFVPLMLQKPSAKSKPRDHIKYLKSRLQRWSNGQLSSLLNEASEIQKRLRAGIQGKKEEKHKMFVKFMMLGRIGDAAKKINNDDSIKGVHQLSPEIKKILQEKHPESRPVDPDILLPHTSDSPQPVIFEEITSDLVYRTALRMHGSGGPTLVDSENWKLFLCSKHLGKSSSDLCQAIAGTAKILSTEKVQPDCLMEYLACRMIPLDKGSTSEGKPGVRPIGVGEVLRRLIGKLITHVVKDDIREAAGPLQTCTGIQAGIEASIHSMRKVFEQEDTEAILLVDAENAFNNLNRKAALQNIKEICPPFHQYLENTYQKPAKLVIPGEDRYEVIYSQEGTTQGDVAAMGQYGLGMKPLLDKMLGTVNVEYCKQVWYADDSSAAGKLLEIEKWWNTLCQSGPKYGYFPLPKKTILIVKPEYYENAKEIFRNTGVQISVEGERHMGAVIGSIAYKEAYVTEKVNKWVEDIEELAKIAKDEPQAAYACFTKAISHRWTYLQRTVPDIANLFQPLEYAIRDTLIPALLGRKVSDLDRRILALPVRLGGLGIYNPTIMSNQEHQYSLKITENLSRIIINQESDFSNYDKENVKETINNCKTDKENWWQDELNYIMNHIDIKQKRNMKLNLEKGSGVWLTSSPKQALGYALNKQEFRDAICLRYGWSIPNTPSYCECGKRNDIDHTLSCPKGGYVIMRHNKVRDMEAELMREVCHNVQVEPPLLPVDGNNIHEIDDDNKRPDVAGNGVWGSFERTFLDIMITHPNCPSYASKDIQKLYVSQEKTKKRKYNERIVHVERGTFTPIIGSTFGGWGPEANRHHKRIATLMSAKRNESYADIMNYIRTRLRFCVLKSVLIAVRGVRGMTRKDNTTPIADIPFNIIRESGE